MAKWEKIDKRKEHTCSECGEYAPEFKRWVIGYGWNGKEQEYLTLEPQLTPYCPFCGERMENAYEQLD